MIQKKKLKLPETPPVAQPLIWRVEYPRKKDGETEWKGHVSPTGETMLFPTQGQAEDHARYLSIINSQIFRAVGESIGASFIVFDYGQRLVEDALTGERTRSDVQMFEDIDDDDAEVFYVQSRRPHTQNNGKFSAWVVHSQHEFVTLEDAVSEATRLSLQLPRKEFRVVPSDRPLVYRAGAAMPDVEELARLCHVLTPLADADALLLILTEWKGMAGASALINALYGKVSQYVPG